MQNTHPHPFTHITTPTHTQAPQKYPEIVFDTYYLSSFPYAIERPLPPPLRSSISRNLNAQLSAGVSRQNAVLTVANYHGIRKGRVEAVDFLERKRQAIKDAGGELFDDVEQVRVRVALF